MLHQIDWPLLGSRRDCGAQKVGAKLPEADERLLRHCQRSDWKQEAHFELELESHDVPAQRIGVFQFGKQLQAAAS